MQHRRRNRRSPWSRSSKTGRSTAPPSIRGRRAISGCDFADEGESFIRKRFAQSLDEARDYLRWEAEPRSRSRPEQSRSEDAVCPERVRRFCFRVVSLAPRASARPAADSVATNALKKSRHRKRNPNLPSRRILATVTIHRRLSGFRSAIPDTSAMRITDCLSVRDDIRP